MRVTLIQAVQNRLATETKTYVSGGDILEVTAEIVNDGETATTETVEFDGLVVHNLRILADDELDAGETEQVALGFETYPVEQDDTFSVQVTTGESTAEITVTVDAA